MYDLAYIKAEYLVKAFDLPYHTDPEAQQAERGWW